VSWPVVLGEEDASDLGRLLVAARPARVSAVSFVEAAIVVEARQGEEAARDLRELIRATPCDVEPVTAEQAELAVDAWRRFGKGRHPAGLNLGDCFAYALARHTGEPLLFKGTDFARTDVRSAVS